MFNLYPKKSTFQTIQTRYISDILKDYYINKAAIIDSSNVNEVIRVILNFFIFFNKKTLHAQKAQNAYERTKTKKGSIFMRLKSI